ncbi:ATP-binding protein [Paraburkholderia sp. GAS82]|uniref:ATP-binding protein n=1 Tax=Paraburkholderia sp. GAS82 TaxID=3035137 RepID=UPI003D1C11ED
MINDASQTDSTPRSSMSDDLNSQPFPDWIGRRAELYPMHPLIALSVSLPTPPIQELYQDMRRMVLLRESGCSVSAMSGVGKSFALDIIRQQLARDFPGIVVYTHNAHHHDVTSVRGFFQHFLATVNQPNRKGETYELRLRLVTTIVDDAGRSPFKQAVLLVDEAQEMHLSDFRFLKDVYNDLAREGIHLIGILMGEEPAFKDSIKNLGGAREKSLIDRFSHRVFRLRSFQNVADIRWVLRAIDSEVFLESPKVRWTEFFFPIAYASGFRLEHEAEALWNALTRAKRQSRRSDGVSARVAFRAIKEFLTDNAGADARTPKLPSDAWMAAVGRAIWRDALAQPGGATDGTESVKT